MKNVLLMSVFGLFMTVAFAGQSVSSMSFVAAAYADNDSENASNRQDDNEHESQGVSENAHNSSSDDESNSSDDDNESASNDDDSNSVAFSCPEGVTTCYRADGSEYTDVNNLTATAAGTESDDGETYVLTGYEDDEDDHHGSVTSTTPASSSTAKYANPRVYRSF